MNDKEESNLPKPDRPMPDLPVPDLPHGRLHMETHRPYEADPECVSRRGFFA